MKKFNLITVVSAETDEIVSHGVIEESDYIIDAVEDILIKKSNKNPKEIILLKYEWLKENHPELII
jgi:hypothetical protein